MRASRLRTIGAAILAALALGLPALPETEPAPTPRWIEKAARALRAGHGLAAGEELAPYLRMSREEVLASLMADSRFADTVLDFNLYHLGLKPDRLREASGHYNPMIFSAPQAISSARAVLSKGDYFELFRLSHPLYLPALYAPKPQLPGDERMEPAALRRKVVERAQASLDRFIEAVRRDPGMSRSYFHTRLHEHWEYWLHLGFPWGIGAWARTARGWYGDAWSASMADEVYARSDRVALLEQAKRADAAFFAQLPRFEPDRYRTPTVAELQSLDVRSAGVVEAWGPINYDLDTILPNSVTNFNRKRGAYVLSRYFCDDLTPIQVIAAGGHGKGRHASEASCQSCHYKLDPMAGFFRDYGAYFKDYSDLPFVLLSDGSKPARAPYQEAWRAPPGSGREWEAGYVRSARDQRLNSYGSGMEDLFAIIAQAPEAKRCLVKRLLSYFVGETQAIDAGYREQLSARFIEESRRDSVGALKLAIRRILLSRAFSEPDPVPGRCYDLPGGASPQDAPPCQVAFVLARNCASCHGGGYPMAGLDLTRWIPLPDGTRGFAHVDAGGRQLPRQVTLERIVDRLTTLDEERRMPWKRHIDGADREAIYVWAKQGL
jgi:hypothetical protein